MTVSYDAVEAHYFGIPSIVQRLPFEVSLANFTVLSGANKLQRPVAGGIVHSGALKSGQTIIGNISNNTLTGQYSQLKLSTFGYNESSPLA